MAGCGCSSSTITIAGAQMDPGTVDLWRAATLQKIANLGAADACPTTREFEVQPRTGINRELFTVRPGPVPGYAVDLVFTYPTTTEALDAALARLAEVGGRLIDQCPPGGG